MGRRPGQTCSLCDRGVSLKESRDDGNGGRKCKPDCAARKAADVKAPPPAPVEAAEKNPRVNRRGKPTAENEAARTCRVCECSAEKPCDDGAGRSCVWTSSETPAAGDLCTVCADPMVLADELLDEGMAPADVAKRVEEDSAPCVDAARTAKILERVIAARTPSKKDRPCDTRKLAPEPPAQATLPGSEVARTLTLPMPREPLAVVPADRGACEACGTKLTPENSSKLPSGRVAHVGCAASAPSSDHRAPCTDCGAEQGEPCAHATPEPASYIHDARLALLPAEERGASRRRAAEDRIRVALDEHAKIPGDPPVPSHDGLVRGLMVPGDFDVFTLADTLGAMIERGEVIEHVSERWPGAKYLRRAPGSPPVVMGRVGVATKPGSGASEWAALAEMDRAAKPPVEETEIGDEYGEEVRDTEALEADDSGHAHTPTPPPPGVEFAVSEEAFRSLVSTGGMSERPALTDTDDNIAALLSERPDERLAAQLGAAASHVEDLATFVRHATESLQALRAQRRSDNEGFELALRTESFEKDQLARAVSELRAELATAKDLARLASLEAADAKDESRALRGALANIVEALGGTVPENDSELISEAVSRARRPRSEPLRGALRDIVGELSGELPENPTDEQLCVGAITAASNALKAVSDLSGQVEAVAAERNTARSERDIAQGDRQNLAGRVMRLRAFIAPLAGLPAPHEATDHELIAAAEGRIPVLVAVVEGAIGELTGASATSAKPLAEQLHEAVRAFGPRAGDFSTELETAAVLAVHRLTGEPAPMGKGRVAIAEALTAAVEATAAKLTVRRMRVPGATPETGTQPKPRVVF